MDNNAVFYAETNDGIIREAMTLENLLTAIDGVDYGIYDFLIINTNNGFFQFSGYEDQFVGEIRINYTSDFSTYSLINDSGIEDITELYTPFQTIYPPRHQIVTKQAIQNAIKILVDTKDINKLVESIPCEDTTILTKMYMGGGY